MSTRRLYRSRRDKSLAGVAGGMAEYLDIDPTVVRVLWILSAFVGGFTILLYIILAFVMPLEPLAARPPLEGATPAGGEGFDPEATQWSPTWAADAGAPAPRGDGKGAMAVGIALVVFGLIALVGPVFPAWASAALGPAFILAIGIALVAVSVRRQATES